MAIISYVEEDGFEIIRGEDRFYLCGSCEGEYSYYHSAGCAYLRNGDPGYPEEYEVTCESFDCWIDEIYDAHSNSVDITLTEEEYEMWESHMQNCLDEEANNYEFEDEEEEYDEWDHRDEDI